MSSPQGSKPSKWGSFLQQAVAGVESRLDTMLATEEEAAQQKAFKEKAAPKMEKEDTSPRSSLTDQRAPLRSSSRSKANDRLQERLAKAIARKSSPVSISSRDEKSSTSGSFTVTEGRASVDSVATRKSIYTISVTESNQELADDKPVAHDERAAEKPHGETEEKAIRVNAPEDDYNEPRPELVAKPEVPEQGNQTEEGNQGKSSDSIANHDGDGDGEKHWRQEMHEYMEKIDALQSKLKYLAQQAAESANSAAASAAPGSLEKKLLEKDEQIANLMTEGNKLSKIEMDNRAAIKRLRVALADKNKAHLQLQRKVDTYEDEVQQRNEELQAAKRLATKNNSIVAAAVKKEKELAPVISERDALLVTVSELNQKLSEANARAGQAGQAAQSKVLEAERRRAQEAQDDFAQFKLEKEISDNKFMTTIQNLKDSIEREKEKSRLLEVELGAERTALEQKLETLRSQAEEASSSASGDARAKLLRQIETLQSQYSIASENWQRIEGSLVARLTTVEKERDEIEKTENEVRRKLRDANLRAKKSETELESSRNMIQELQRDLDLVKQKLERSTKKYDETEQQLASAKEDLVKERQLIEMTVQQRIEEEKLKWQESFVAAEAHPPLESPMPYSRKSSLMEQYRTPSSKPRSSIINFPSGESMERALPSTIRHNSTTSTPSFALGRHPSNDFSVLSSVADMPNINSLEADESPNELMRSSMQEEGAATHTSFGNAQSRGVNDLISASTVGAGPSVQLVERMSATVRRLESERAASKDELARLTSQRDEARQEVVSLMREVEEKRKCDERIKELSATLEDLDQRYNTTLEMLGEKSEQVEELQADVVELKRIYRELVDSTMQ
ncbi:hypothetical protein KEM54_000217 [Ascosphaera aggregata]|nr:hypothetical protein KEM54_000217 [Ascosphaera aggregata]